MSNDSVSGCLEYQSKDLKGIWKAGWALDIHTLSSVLVGPNEFDTKRSAVGEALYRLKYQNDKSQLEPLAQTAAGFLKTRFVTPYLKAIIPVPPSDTSRLFQPVPELAKLIGKKLNIPFYPDVLKKVKVTKVLKNIEDPEERHHQLANAFEIYDTRLSDKKILLFDDIYRSGETLTEITRILTTQGGVDRVYVLTLTMTRANK